jgi:plastocyanin
MRAVAFAGLVILAACGGEAVAPEDHNPTPNFKPDGAGFGSTATMAFGKDGVGSDFDPATGHDRSHHAYDKVRPKIVQIAAGGSVTFEIGTFHSVVVYEPGVDPEDINLGATIDLTAPIFIPDFLIDDPDGRIVADNLAASLPLVPFSWTTPAGTFDTPGRYLVICRVFPHFAFSSMYGWVNVK